MKIEIQHIPSDGAALSFRKQAKEFTVLKEMMDKAECGPFTPLDIDLSVRIEGDLVLVQGDVNTAVELVCSRCVESFSFPIRHRFTLRYSREIPDDLHGADTEEIELTADKIGLIYFRGETIDFKDAVQEQVVMALPFKPLCREECKGLCPQCGTDLNIASCKCGNGKDTGPFSALKHLKLPRG